jgi:hypothetical protein
MAAHSPIRFWIAADLLTQARAHGVALPADFQASMTGAVRDAHCRALVEEREAALHQRREAARRDRWRAGGWRF